ncbi:MAG: iron-containing alcohol dehydrogenase [candidate division WOR-3 bacterium]
MKSFNIFLPVKYSFGTGILEKKLVEVLPLLGNRILIVTGRNFARRYGFLDKIKEICKSFKIEFIHYDKISPNPKTYEIEETRLIVRENKINALLGFGGGSVMDAVKAISIIATNEGKIWDYTMLQKSPENETLPVCLIPTTPATGSEINSSAIITNIDEKRKWGIFDEKIFPKFSIVDPILSKTLDKDYLALCSIDIITHILEPFVTSKEEGVLIKGVAKFYIKKVIESIKTLIKNPEDIKARENMHLLASLALSGVATRGIGGFHEMHWLEHIVSGFYDNVPHPAGLAILLIPWLSYSFKKRKDNIKELFSFIMEKENPDFDEIIDYMDKFYKEINLPRNFKNYGIEKSDFELFWKEYNFLSGKFPKFFPEKIEERDFFEIFEKTLI